MRPRPIVRAAARAALVLAAAVSARAQAPIRGFPAALLPAQHAREAAARAVPSPDTLSAHMRRLARGPHLAGTPASRAVAEALRDRWRGYGLAVELERVDAWIPMPAQQVVELVAPGRHRATFVEPPVPGDPATAGAYPPAFGAYAGDGAVTGEVVYVNYGFPEDYRLLDSLGISVRGKVVLARDGGVSSPKWILAAERGAVGCLIYHDPRDEGYFTGDAVPRGPRRPEFAMRTGTVARWEDVGDVFAATRDATPGGTAIPVMVLSGRDALPILRQLGGPVAPLDWRGAHPVTYRLGPGGPARVRMALRSTWARRALYNVVATLPGARSSDQWVLLGTHHDAIGGPGADDPVSALVAIDEVVRALAQLRARGWRPARTIKVAAWDGEEFGILGSRAWAERHADALRRHAVAYLNGDNVQAGWFRAQGPPSLQPFVVELLRDVPDPARGMSVLEAWQQGPGIMSPGGGVIARDGGGARPFTLAPMGLNTDAAPFGLLLGLPAMHMAYSGKAGPLGARHSRYETWAYYRTHLDPGFGTVALLAQTYATALLRLADAPVLPFAFAGIAPTWREQLAALDRAARATAGVGALPLAGTLAALDSLAVVGAAFDAALGPVQGWSADEVGRRWEALAAANAQAYRAEQALLDPAPAPEGRFNRHVVQGTTGLYSRSGVNPFPHLARAVLERRDGAAARDAVARVEAALWRYRAAVAEAAASLAAAGR